MDFGSSNFPGSGAGSTGKGGGFTPPGSKEKGDKKDKTSEWEATFNREEYERKFDPSKIRKQRADNTKGIKSYTAEELKAMGLLSEDSESSKEEEGSKRSIASFVVSSESVFSSGEGEGEVHGSSQENYISMFGRGSKETFKKAVKAFRGPTVAEKFNIHGSEVDLLARQRELAEEFCSTHYCGFDK